MRSLGAIVGIGLGIVGNAWQDRSTGSRIALQLVGDDPEWLLALTAPQSAKEPLGCTLIAAGNYPLTAYCQGIITKSLDVVFLAANLTESPVATQSQRTHRL
jgi:hypothetical protein